MLRFAMLTSRVQLCAALLFAIQTLQMPSLIMQISRRASASGVCIAGADLQGSVLRGMRLIGADMRDTKLNGADLADAVLDKACLSGVSAVGATFDRSTLRVVKAIAGNFRDASLVEVDLSEADLHRSNLSQVNLLRADLRKSSLQRAKLQNAELGGADLRGACFDGCNVGGCSLKACRVSLSAMEEGGAIGLETMRSVSLRVDDCYFCEHCGRSREVWGTLTNAEAHHRQRHPALSQQLMPIPIEEGCSNIAVAVEVGQASWCKGGT